MKVIREQLIDAAKTYTDFNQNLTYQPSMKKRIVLVCRFHCFFDSADLRSYCGYFLAICQLCFQFRCVCFYLFYTECKSILSQRFFALTCVCHLFNLLFFSFLILFELHLNSSCSAQQSEMNLFNIIC